MLLTCNCCKFQYGRLQWTTLTMATRSPVATAIRANTVILMSIPRLTLILSDTGFATRSPPKPTHVHEHGHIHRHDPKCQNTDPTSCISRVQRTIMATTIKAWNHILTIIDLPGSAGSIWLRCMPSSNLTDGSISLAWSVRKLEAPVQAGPEV